MDAACEILDPSKHSDEDKPTRKDNDVVDVNMQLVDVTNSIRSFCNNVELAYDVMRVSDIPFVT